MRKAFKQKVFMGNKLVLFAIALGQACRKLGADGKFVGFLLEHPEDLGRAPLGVPASLRQLSEVRRLVEDPAKSGSRKRKRNEQGVAEEEPPTKKCKHQWYTFAFFQCAFEVDYSKPTRIVQNFEDEENVGHHGWPQFDAREHYCGPLPESCGHWHREKTVGRLRSGGFATAAKAAYPEKMNAGIARNIGRAFIRAGADPHNEGQEIGAPAYGWFGDVPTRG